MEKSVDKIKRCEAVSSNLQQSLGELENERDDAKSLINETFQVCSNYQLVTLY